MGTAFSTLIFMALLTIYQLLIVLFQTTNVEVPSQEKRVEVGTTVHVYIINNFIMFISSSGLSISLILRKNE